MPGCLGELGDGEHARGCWQAEADIVGFDVVEAGLLLAGWVLEQFGFDRKSVLSWLDLEWAAACVRGTQDKESVYRIKFS